MNLSVHSPRATKGVIWGLVACGVILLLLGATLFIGYQDDRNEDAAQRREDRAQAVEDREQRIKDREQISALGDAVNVLVGQVDSLGGVPVVDSAQEVNPDAPPPPIPGRDGRDGTNPPCLSTPAQCVGDTGADGATPADGVDGAKGDPGINGEDSTVPGPKGEDSTVPGPEGPPCPPGTTGGFFPAPLPSTGTWWVCAVDPP